MTMNLLDFANPIAHTGDPDTSHEAAARVTAVGTRSRHTALVLAMVKRHPWLTAAELWARATPTEAEELGELQECRRRLTDLEAKGLVFHSAPRLCSVRGTRMVTWRAV